MVKKILLLLFIVFTVSFGEVNDSRSYLKESDKQEIESKILEMEKNDGINYYVNIGNKMDDSEKIEKTIILDIIPDGKNDVNVQLKFTQDIDTTLHEEEIDNVLVQGEELLIKKQYKEFILKALEVSEKVVEDIKKEKIEVEKKEIEGTVTQNKFAIFVILLLIGLSIFVTLKFIRHGKKKKKRRM